MSSDMPRLIYICEICKTMQYNICICKSTILMSCNEFTLNLKFILRHRNLCE